MAYINYTDEQKNTITKAVCDEIQLSATPISEICKRHNISYHALRSWSLDNDDFAYRLIEAQTERAWQYIDEAMALIDSAPIFFEDSRGNRHESSVALNKIRYQVEHRRKMAEILSQEIFGNYWYQIKEVMRQLKLLQQKAEKLDSYPSHKF